MDTSKFLSKVIGIYLVILTLGFFINMQNFNLYIYNLINNAPLMFFIGCFTLILGALMVVSHNVWQLNWKVIITIISWLTFLKGISLVLYPQFIDEITLLFLRNSNFAYASIGFDFIIAIVLCYYGFKSSKGKRVA